MTPIRLVLALILAASCRPSGREVRALIGAPLAALDLAAPWPLHVIAAGASTGPQRGADGIDLVGGDIATAWEEGGAITIAHRPADLGQPWLTDVVASGVTGVEDAKLGDIDGDGIADVVSGSDSGQRVYVSFGDGPTIDVVASHGHNRVMQVAVADVGR